ncbi:MAG: HIT domain-containing protein [Candidatus Dojkabacteria bacterium]|nr:HIT domain-containing protein [Candidatus Dojkabacteria bacterium]
METDTVFHKIVRREIPCYVIYEDTNFLAFLDIFPLAEGHTLLIPKKYYRYVWDVENYCEYLETARKIVRHFQKITKNELVFMKIIGTDIPYAHIHIIPGNTQKYEARLTEEDARRIVEKYKMI